MESLLSTFSALHQFSTLYWGNEPMRKFMGRYFGEMKSLASEHDQEMHALGDVLLEGDACVKGETAVGLINLTYPGDFFC